MRKRNAEHQRGELGAGPQHQIGDHDARDRARSADQRHLRAWIAEHEGEARQRADQRDRSQEAQAAERLLDIVGEHPEEDQVADQMHDVGMQELVGEERQPRTDRARESCTAPDTAAGITPNWLAITSRIVVGAELEK